MWWGQRRARKIGFKDVPKDPKPVRMGPGLLDLRAGDFNWNTTLWNGLQQGSRLWLGEGVGLTRCHMTFLGTDEGSCIILISAH